MPGTAVAEPAASRGPAAPLRWLDERLDGPLPPARGAVLRLRQAAVCLGLVVLAFVQSPGLVSPDTKLDLTEDPAGWLAAALRVWSDDGLGSLQNQAYGYLFPMGSFHLLGLEAGLPAWVVQRLWWSVLLVGAFLGVVRLAARLGIGTPGGRVLAGLVYALSPRVLTELGGLSSEVLPLAVLPWVLVPLVGAAAEQRPRSAAARSAVAVLCAGAVNAAATLLVLPLAGLWLLPGLRRAGGRRLAGWWVLCVALACSWWVVPLLVQGYYSAPFLDYIEDARLTTSLTSPVEVVRGTSQWLAYLAVDGEPYWRAGWTLVTSPIVIVDTAVLAGLGLAGLASRGLPCRGRLVAGAAIGLLVMSAGHAGALDAPFSGLVRDLLDGPLAPFRNVHKADPLLRLPLALGLCHVLTRLPEPRPRRMLAGLAVIAVVGTATPALVGQLAPDGAYEEVPRAWRDAAAFVDLRAEGTSTLLVPAAGDAEHVWGRPLDDPLQAHADGPVVVRDAVPLGGPEITRLLDAVGSRLDTGRGSAGLAPVLARAGIGHVVVRNDLDRTRTGAPRPVLVAQALRDSPGLRRVASFGRRVGDDGVRDGLVADRGLDRPRRAVEVWQVEAASGPVTTYPRDGAWQVAGGPEALLQLADRGLLGDVGVLVAGDGDIGPRGRAAVSDALRRREVDVGRVREGASVTLTPEDPLRLDRVTTDVAQTGGPERVSVARWTGVDDVQASSSAADVDALLGRGAARAPVSALDEDPGTAWVTGTGAPAGQWLEVRLEAPADLTGARLLPAGPSLSPELAHLVEVEVRTDAGTARTRLTGEEVEQPLAVPPGRTSVLRLTVTGVEAGEALGRLTGVRELTLPGVDARRTVVLPPEAPGLEREGALLLLDEPTGARGGCVRDERGTACSPALVRDGEEPGPLDRTFRLPTPAVLPVTGGARGRPGPALDLLLDADAPVRVTATSRAVDDPLGRPAAVVDGDRGTGWVAGADDDTPALTLRWEGQRELEAVDLVRGDLVAARALRVGVQTATGEFAQSVPTSGRVRPLPGPTDFVRVRVLESEELVDVSTGGRLTRLPVGFAEVRLPGLDDLAPVRIDGDEPVALPCGSGPDLRVDGVPVPTAALGSRADLLALRPMLLQACGAPLSLAAGEHRVVAGADTGPLEVVSLTLGDPGPPPPPAPGRPVEVREWDDEARTVEVGPGGDSWLVVRQNANAGWRAELGGEPLAPARVDGWQQAWLLPAGEGGTVRLVYGPGALHRAGLAAGAVGVLALLTLALLPKRRAALAAPGQGDARAARPARAGRALALAAPALLTGVLGGVVGLLVGAAVTLAVLRARLPAPLIALVATTGAGVAVAVAPWSGSRAPGALGLPAAVLALVAVAAVAAAVVGALVSRTAVSPGPPAASGAGPAAPPPPG